MRIRSLWLRDFKNLKDFHVDFDDRHAVSVVVGRNGSGKSNLLEALSIIFRDLDLGKPASIDYEIQYSCRNSSVHIAANATAERKLVITIDSKKSSYAMLRGNTGVRYLPDFVFGYYFGASNRLKAHFAGHQETFSRALREGKEQPLRRLFYAQPMHSQFVLMAFFLDSSNHDFLREYLKIEGLESILFILQQPYWASRGATHRATGDSRFWNARGAVADLLDRLYFNSLAPMRRTLDIQLDQGRRERREHLYLFLRDVSVIQHLANSYYDGKPQELFKAFESILAADLLSEVRIRVKTRGSENALVFRELSEGEQQLLMVLGLLRFTREDESLFLLDEPDTHLNPAWSMDYARMLETNSESESSSSQLLMATHDPLVIAGLLKDQVVILRRGSGDGRVQATTPDTDPRGMGVSGLLTSDIYGLASELDPITLEKVERRRWLAASDYKSLSEVERKELKNLTAELEDLEFTFATKDPLFRDFERAMTAVEQSDRTDLRPRDVKRHHAEAERIVQQLLESEGRGVEDPHDIR